MIADLRTRDGLTWADIIGLAALAAHDSGEPDIAEALGAAARRCAQIEEAKH